MKVIERYILKEAFGYFLISLAAFTSVLLSVRILRFANLIINKGVAFEQIATVFVAIIPTFMEFAVPMAALLGCVLAIARLSGDSEIVVLRASGVSILQLLRPVMLYGILVTLLALSLSLYLRPWGYRKLDQTLFEIAQSKTTSGLEAGIFNQLGKLMLYADQVDYSNGALTNVLVDDRRTEGERKIIVARNGTISSNPETYEILIRLGEGTIHEKANAKYSLTQFNNNFLRIDANELMGRGKRSENQKVNQLSLKELWHQINNYATEVDSATDPQVSAEKPVQAELAAPADPATKATDDIQPRKKKRPLGELRFELARRFSLPFASLLLAVLGLPLGIQPPRLQKTWGATFSLSLGLIIFALYFGLLTFGSALGERGALNAELAAWLPNICMLGLAIYLLRSVGTERWQSVAHGFEKIASLLNRFSVFRRTQVHT